MGMEATMISKFNASNVGFPYGDKRIWVAHMDFEFPRHPLCMRPESNSILISIFELILILIMSFVFSRDDAVSNTVSRSVVAGKLGLAPHPVQNEGNCTWIRSVDVTCDYLRRLRSPWSPTGIAPWGTVTRVANQRSQRLRRIGLSWVASRFCKRQFFSFKSRCFTVRFCQIRKNTSSDEFLSFIPLWA